MDVVILAETFTFDLALLLAREGFVISTAILLVLEQATLTKNRRRNMGVLRSGLWLMY